MKNLWDIVMFGLFLYGLYLVFFNEVSAGPERDMIFGVFIACWLAPILRENPRKP